MTDLDRLVTEAERREAVEAAVDALADTTVVTPTSRLDDGRIGVALDAESIAKVVLDAALPIALRGVGEERDRLRAALLAVLDGVQVCEGYPEDHDWYDEGRAVLAGPENPKGGE